MTGNTATPLVHTITNDWSEAERLRPHWDAMQKEFAGQYVVVVVGKTPGEVATLLRRALDNYQPGGSQ